MRVRFLTDFQGVLTAEQYYLLGSQADFEAAIAEQLIADGRAVAVGDRVLVAADADDRDEAVQRLAPRKRGR